MLPLYSLNVSKENIDFSKVEEESILRNRKVVLLLFYSYDGIRHGGQEDYLMDLATEEQGQARTGTGSMKSYSCQHRVGQITS